MPDADAPALEAQTLRDDLDSITPQGAHDVRLVSDYRAYTEALERMARLLAALARPG
ncbi:hypothetical protein [Streptomyces sp. NPDC021356]|uniref:hypothetical protein n=1 Tax=Streptomyces sp. NPDC021356 TaxID=3154900 RepID=UPI00341094EE